MRSNVIYILIMAGVSFLIRVLPLTVIRKQIKNTFVRSFLYYVPYVTISVMTFPAIIEATDNPYIGGAALIIGVILAWLGVGLFPVALACCFTVFALTFGGQFVNSQIDKNIFYGENKYEYNLKETELPDGTVYIRNLEYDLEQGSQANTENYPNSCLDIAYSSETSSEKPTIVFVHGGGYVGFTNSMCTIESLGKELDEAFKDYLDQGYNIVSVDYAYAPEYTYPTPLYQLCQAVEYLKDNSDELGLNMENIILMGNSAGGQIVSQYAAARTNEAYAKELGLEFEESLPNIKAVVLQCALIDPQRFDKTGLIMIDITFSRMDKQYFLQDSDSKEADVLNYITDDFPPCYIDDGSEGSFADQAKDLADRLDELGIINEINIYENEMHSFDYKDTEVARDNRKKTIEFLEKL